MRISAASLVAITDRSAYSPSHSRLLSTQDPCPHLERSTSFVPFVPEKWALSLWFKINDGFGAKGAHGWIHPHRTIIRTGTERRIYMYIVGPAGHKCDTPLLLKRRCITCNAYCHQPCISSMSSIILPPEKDITVQVVFAPGKKLWAPPNRHCANLLDNNFYPLSMYHLRAMPGCQRLRSWPLA